jgi:peptidoglycan/xylan/chitin deacetylase (PgdA/CDA1 family)
MKRITKYFLRKSLDLWSRCGLTAPYRRRAKGACILMYHGFTRGGNKGLENNSNLHLNIEGFRQSAAMFAKHYNVIPLQELADRIEAGDLLDDNTIALTFDDGYASNYHLALPILEEFGLHATLFVSTAFIEREIYQWPDRIEYTIARSQSDRLNLNFPGLPESLDISSTAKRRTALQVLDQAVKLIPQDKHLMSIAHIEECAGAALSQEESPAEIYQALTWEQIRELEASDHVSIGAHTHSHPILARCSPEFARRDMEKCLDLLQTMGGVENPTFAYPNGQPGDYNENTKQMLMDLGISVAVTTNMDFNQPHHDIMLLNRMGSPRNGHEADAICSGLVPAIKKQFSNRIKPLSNSNTQVHANCKE